MNTDDKNSILEVSRAEAGQKLLNFLQRRVHAPVNDFHRWIRTGQVRVNGGRVKAFDRVNQGDTVRIPPFAVPLSIKTVPAGEHYKASPSSPSAAPKGELPPVVYEDADILVLAKPAGLPVQGGTGHKDSIAARLSQKYEHTSFIPAPVHRLDKDTTGLLIAGKTYTAVRLLTDALAGRNGIAPRKEYLAWVQGSWPWKKTQELRDLLFKNEKAHRMQVYTDQHTPSKKAEALCTVTPILCRTVHGAPHTLLLIRLLTGRTHQIRIQLASRGYPVAGDPLYGEKTDTYKTKKYTDGLKLHAFRLHLPLPDGSLRQLELLPPWKGSWTVTAKDLMSKTG